MSGQSSQSGWNSWFGPDGEPGEGDGTKPEETSGGTTSSEPTTTGRAAAPAAARAEPVQPEPEPEAEAAKPEAAEVPAEASLEVGATAIPTAGEEKASETLWQPEPPVEAEASAVVAKSAVAEESGTEESGTEAGPAADEPEPAYEGLAAAETVTAATVLAALSDGDRSSEPSEPDEPSEPMRTDPPEPSTWRAPPVPSAEQETALVRPVRLEPDLMPTQIVSLPPLSADEEPTRIVPDVAPTQRVTPAPIWPQPSEPAQLWGAPRDPFAPERPESGQAEAPDPAPAPVTSRSADGEWADWEKDSTRRRMSSTPAAGGGGGVSGGGVSGGGGSGGSSGNGGSGGRGGAGGGRRSSRKVLLGSVGGVVVVGLVLLLVLNQTVFGKSGDKAAPSGFQPTATAPADAAKETAEAFLSAWQGGNLQRAASLTDDTSQALSTLTAYRTNLHLAGLQLDAETSTATTVTPQVAATGGAAGATASPTPGPGGTVTFSVEATVGLPSANTATAGTAGTAGTGSGGASSSASAGASNGGATASASTTASWKYTSHLTAYEQNGGWWIQWTPGLVAPSLTAATKVVSVAIPAQADEVADSAGNTLSGAADVGLRNIAAELKKDAPVGGTPGVEIELQNADGTVVSGTTDKLSAPVNTEVLKTTIDPQVETAAMNAVSRYSQSSMVVIQPSTGYILAVANNAGGNDFALTARIAPGSTNKIITSTALLTSGLLSSTSQAVSCPKEIPINGMSFGNSEGESLPSSTPFLEDFADSCNNAFAQWYDKIGSTTLAQTAQKYYGLNQKWDIGLGPAGPYYNIPASTSNGELAMELFGQGQLEAAPLAMASVAATVANGTFKQPIVVPGTPQLSATPLPTEVQQGLWKMMHAVTQSGGTAAGVYSGVSHEVYGKTGTADVDATTTQKPNSWMVVFDPKADLAIGCVVLGAGFGASYAGPETASVLKALQ